MKVYHVWVDKCGYDEYDACVVVAQNEDNARAMARDNFYEWQGEICVEEVDLTDEYVVLWSFNAG